MDLKYRPTHTADQPTNSDLELASSLAHHNVLVSIVDAREATVRNFSDNTSTVYWQVNCAVSTLGPAARLLRLQALNQRWHRYMPTYDNLMGPANVTFHDCSQRWYLTDSQLLHHFNSSFSQTRPWRLCSLSKRMHSVLISALLTSASDRTLPVSRPMPWTVTGDAGNKRGPILANLG
jgi:hypothetical protein